MVIVLIELIILVCPVVFGWCTYFGWVYRLDTAVLFGSVVLVRPIIFDLVF